MYKKVIVTGASGIAGNGFRSIQDEYRQTELIFTTSKDCDLRESSAVFNLIKSHKPDAIIHLAALSGGVGLSTKYPATILRDNILMNFNILEAARMNSVSKTVMILSSGMYPQDAINPIKEEYIHNGIPHNSNYSYAFAKRLVEPSIRAYRSEYGMNIIGLVPNGIFGENDNFNYEDASMLPALIRRFYENKDLDTDIVIWGDGSPLREYTYAKDIARACLWCLFNYNDAGILNIGNTEEHSVKDIALMIAEFMEVNKDRIKFDTTRPNGIFKKSTDNSKFLKLSNFQYTNFKEALNNTIKWFKSLADKDFSLIRVSPKIKR